jgi:ATP-binding cassette, subfamily B, multidrug efflux pump
MASSTVKGPSNASHDEEREAELKPHTSAPLPYPSTLGGQFRDKLKMYAIGGVLLLIQQTLMAKRDFLVRDAVDAAVAGSSGAARLAALVIVAVSIGAALVRVLSRITVFTAGRNVEYELRALLLDRLQRLGPSFFRTLPTGEIMSRATNDLTQVRLLLGFGILNIIGSLFALISAAYVMFSISPRLSAASLATLPFLWLVTRTFSTRMFRATKANQEAIGKMSDRVLASLAGVRVVRAFGLVPSEQVAFDASNQDYLNKSLDLARIRGSMGPIMGTISAAGILVVFWYGGSLIARGEISNGDFVSFWLALLRLTWPLLALGFVAAILQRGRAAYDRLRVIFEAEPEITDGPLVRDSKVRGHLKVENLVFAYEKRNVVDGVSFEVPPGTSLAIVGPTGSGKSTIASLLSRIMPTPAKSVFLDGDDICELSLARVRGGIAYAQQEAFLFSTTVTRNIGYAFENADAPEVEAEIRQAAREAEVEREVNDLPDGFDTVVGERGVQLSGGQRQRVALARALLRHAPVLVLDDPLSAVDAKTETAILEAIDRQRALRTVVLITHRVAAAKRCDYIIVLNKGKVVERGTHTELVANEGLYATFAREQEILADLEAIDLGATSSKTASKETEAAPS